MHINQRSLFTVVVAFAIALLACSPLGGGAATKTPPTPAVSPVPQGVVSTATPETGAATPTTATGSETTAAATPTGEATEVPTPTYDSVPAQLTMPPLLTATAATAAAANGSLRQWAAAAQASSQYGDLDWAATQATGAPNSSADCGDNKTAWASANNDGHDNLEVVYTTAVVPVAINIYETNAPGSIVKVDVLEANGAAHTVFTGLPLPTQQCPRTLSIGITGVTSHVTRVNIYVDQSVVKAWDEIDAVELVGNP